MSEEGRTNRLTEELREQVGRYNWYHCIDLGSGVVTSGICGPPNPAILSVFDDIDFGNKKVLDIGCWDGLWSFEAEKRGAREVYATDKIAARPFGDQPTFQLAHQILGSKVRYFPDLSVYDVRRLGVDDFDVVIFCGLFYHLKEPLLAFARLRQVMKEGGIIIVEGEVIESRHVWARFYYREWLQNDRTNWWVPTIPCLREWIECSFFEIEKESYADGDIERLTSRLARYVLRRSKNHRLFHRFLPRDGTFVGEGGHRRYLITARARCRKDPNYACPDDELRDFALEAD